MTRICSFKRAGVAAAVGISGVALFLSLSSPVRADVTGVEVLRQDSGNLLDGEATSFNIYCPAGKIATGGGFVNPTSSATVHDQWVLASAPHNDASGWEFRGVNVANNGQQSSGFSAWVVCADEGP